MRRNAQNPSLRPPSPNDRELQRCAMINLIVGGIIGIVASILASMWIENLRRPKLSLTIETPPLDNHAVSSRETLQQTAIELGEMDGASTGAPMPCGDYLPPPRRSQCLWPDNGRALVQFTGADRKPNFRPPRRT